jgi:hypothetical protein
MINSMERAEMEEKTKAECNDCGEGSSEDGAPSGLKEAPNAISNDHTAQWRVYTDMGRDFFVQV